MHCFNAHGYLVSLNVHGVIIHYLLAPKRFFVLECAELCLRLEVKLNKSCLHVIISDVIKF